jgi:hypothetical protein
MINIDMSITELERTNLEAHVEISAEREELISMQFLEVKSRLIEINEEIKRINNLITTLVNYRQNQLISWGIAIISVLISSTAFLAYTLFQKR